MERERELPAFESEVQLKVETLESEENLLDCEEEQNLDLETWLKINNGTEEDYYEMLVLKDQEFEIMKFEARTQEKQEEEEE